MAHNVVTSRKDRRGSKATDGRNFSRKESSPVAFLDQVFTRVKPKASPYKQEATPDVKTPANSGNNSQDPITLLIAKNPEMNASTFFNLLKSEGFIIAKDPAVAAPAAKKEADMSSGNPQALRAKESRKPVGFKTRIFLESAQPVDDSSGMRTRYKVVMLEEGMGNFGASAYYSKEALESAIPIFEGKKIYADHPAESEAEERPERSVRDILGHFENVHVQESKSGQHWLCGDLVVMGGQSYQWARELMEHAVAFAKKFPDKEFVGLSINASGDSEPLPIDQVMKKGVPEGALAKIQEAKKQGIETLTYVSKFNEAVSCDLVTEAGAGGKILSLIEGAKKMQTEAEKKAEADKKEADAKAAKEAADAKAKEADGVQGDDQKKGGHADAAQDVELIKKMIAKHGGGDEEVSDEECAVVKEAYEAHKEMGCKDEEAESKAVGYLKASKHMAAKREAAKQEAAKNAGSESGADDKKAESDKSAESDKKESGVKESAQKSEIEKLREENLRLKGEAAGFKESERKAAVASHIEKICKESKLHNSVTGEFKKLVESSKSVEEVDKAWKVFHEGYRSRKASAESALDFGGMVIDAEKATFTESDKGSGLNLGACLKED